MMSRCWNCAQKLIHLAKQTSTHTIAHTTKNTNAAALALSYTLSSPAVIYAVNNKWQDSKQGNITHHAIC